MLSVVDGLLSAINRLLIAFVSVLLMLMAGVIALDVVGRNLNLLTVPWSAELAGHPVVGRPVLHVPGAGEAGR